MLQWSARFAGDLKYRAAAVRRCQIGASCALRGSELSGGIAVEGVARSTAPGAIQSPLERAAKGRFHPSLIRQVWIVDPPTAYRSPRYDSIVKLRRMWADAAGLTYNAPHYPGAGRLTGRDAQLDRTLVKEADPEGVEEWESRLRRSRAAAAELAKPVGDVALKPYAHEIAGLRRRRDSARTPQCRLKTQ